MLNKIKNFFTGSYGEFKKVVWPSRKQVISHTIIVVVSMAVAMAIIAALDLGLASILQILIERR